MEAAGHGAFGECPQLSNFAGGILRDREIHGAAAPPDSVGLQILGDSLTWRSYF